MQTEFNKKHLDHFLKIGPIGQVDAVGFPPYALHSYLESKSALQDVSNGETLSKKAITRHNLINISQNTNISDLHFTISVLAWGGIRRNHCVSLMQNWDKWGKIIKRLRYEDISRVDAYDEFQFLRKKGVLPGMGPAYFTKLIFFAGQSHSGYIMDQWTGRSINLLTDRSLVNMIKLGNLQRVSDSNSSTVYEHFCLIIEELHAMYPVFNSPVTVEESLFSYGGKNRGEWRDYLITTQ